MHIYRSNMQRLLTSLYGRIVSGPMDARVEHWTVLPVLCDVEYALHVLRILRHGELIGCRWVASDFWDFDRARNRMPSR